MTVKIVVPTASGRHRVVFAAYFVNESVNSASCSNLVVEATCRNPGHQVAVGLAAEQFSEL
jgi:hypothetical protein